LAIVFGICLLFGRQVAELYTAATARLRERAAGLLADAVARSRELPPSVLDEHLFV
jgi:hypothetical protein